MGSALSICAFFFGVFGIGLVAGFTLRAVASFIGELEFGFFVVRFCPYPPS